MISLRAATLLLQERHHGRFVLFNGDRVGDRVFEEVGDLLAAPAGAMLLGAGRWRLEHPTRNTADTPPITPPPIPPPEPPPTPVRAWPAIARCCGNFGILPHRARINGRCDGLILRQLRRNPLDVLGIVKWLINEIGLPETSDR